MNSNMKLYATTTSERASKGQGGNKYLEIAIQVELEDGTRDHFTTMRLEKNENNGLYQLRIDDEYGEEIITINKKAKSNK